MKKSSAAPKDSSSSVKGAPDTLQVTVYWGDILYDTAVCRPSESITVGRNPDNTFVYDLPVGGPTGDFKLVEVQPGQMANVRFSDNFGGHLRIGKEMFSLGSARESNHVVRTPDGAYQATIGAQDKADVEIGHLTFYLDWIKDMEVLPKSPPFSRNGLGLGLGIVSLIAVLALLFHFVQFEEEKPPERIVTILPPPQKAANAAMGQKQTKDGGAETGEIGKAETSPAAEVKKEPSALDKIRSANLSNVVGSLTSLGNAAPEVSGKVGVTAPIAQEGTGGFSTEGLKKGGGGKSVGIGRTVGQGSGGFEGTGHLGLSGNTVGGTGTGHGGTDTRVAGGLDPDVIESVIRRRLDRIRLCYERQLNFNPKLAGKVTVHFVIAGDGSVLSSRASEDTMKNDAVRGCILGEVKSWTFPKPEGGTTVNVDYPFVFESSARGN